MKVSGVYVIRNIRNGKGRVKSLQEIENLKKAWLTRGPMPPVSQETRDKLRSAGVETWKKRKSKGGVSSH